MTPARTFRRRNARPHRLARRKFAEERWPLSPALRPVREALAKLDPKPEPEPLPAPKPYEPNTLAKRKKRR